MMPQMPQKEMPLRMPAGMPMRPGQSMGGRMPMQKKPTITPAPKELAPFSRRSDWRGFGTKDVGWALKSHKGDIYQKHQIGGKKVEEFVAGLKQYGSVIDRREAGKIEKMLLAKSRFSKDLKIKEESKKWLKVIRDPKILKK